MIELQKVTKIYKPRRQREVTALDNATLKVSPGEFLVITGRSGCGKTTILNLLAALARPTLGKVFIDGIDIWTLDDRQISALRKEKIGFIFQVPSLIPVLNVVENVMVPTMFTTPEKQLDAYDRAEKALADVGLSHKMEAFPRHLSAGEEKRVIIARAIVDDPPFLLADEPTANLDELTEKEVMALLESIHKGGTSIVLVTHHPSLIGYGTRHLTMSDAKLTE
ncbi:MAG: ATP-binding cassette domain-containing protein [Proteobacteria bacterium]|nr:ATP-binding cassette domain-containing protein [Pseudomonadota bacterium]